MGADRVLETVTNWGRLVAVHIAFSSNGIASRSARLSCLPGVSKVSRSNRLLQARIDLGSSCFLTVIEDGQQRLQTEDRMMWDGRPQPAALRASSLSTTSLLNFIKKIVLPGHISSPSPALCAVTPSVWKPAASQTPSMTPPTKAAQFN